MEARPHDVRRCEVLLSTQRALLDAVTPNLRVVIVEFDNTSITFEAFYDGRIGEEEAETMALVETLILADFPWAHRVAYRVTRLDAPAGLPRVGTWVYLRKE